MLIFLTNAFSSASICHLFHFFLLDFLLRSINDPGV